MQLGLIALTLLIWFVFSTIAMQGFENWPNLIGSRALVLCSLVVGALTTILIVLESSRLIVNRIFLNDNATAMRALHHLMMLFTFSAIYAIAAFSTFWIQTGMMHPAIILTIVIIVWVCVAAILLIRLEIRALHQQASIHKQLP